MGPQPAAYSPRHATTNTVRPAENSNAAPFNSELGKASSTLNQQFPNSPAATGFDTRAVENLRYRLLENSIDDERIIGIPNAGPALRSAYEDAKQYWGFTDDQQIDLKYSVEGEPATVDGVLASAPRLSDMGITSTDEDDYALISPFMPNLVPPKSVQDGRFGLVQLDSNHLAELGEAAVSTALRAGDFVAGGHLAYPGSRGERDDLNITFKLPSETSNYDGAPRIDIRVRKGKGSGIGTPVPEEPAAQQD